MITVSTRQLVSAIEEAEVFRMPDMNEGASYLYHDIYRRLLEGVDLRLSEIDFDCFELDDIDAIRELHSDLEANEYKAHTLMRLLQDMSPTASAAAFV